MQASFLKVDQVQKTKQQQLIVKPTSFEINAGQKVAIAGETGSGKSTLLKMIAGWEQPDSGNVYFKNEKVWTVLEKLLPGQKGIAYLSQHFELLNNYYVKDLVDFDNKLSKEKANNIYDVCEISHLLHRKTNQLSGGEKQRIATAKLLIGAPELLILDEPFSNLDPTHKATMKQVIDNIGNELKVTCMLVSHDPIDSLSWADEIMVMQAGTIIQQNKPTTIYHQPVNSYVAGLFGRYNQLTEEVCLALKTPTLVNKMVRPEYFYLTPATANNLDPIVNINQILFMGSYFAIEVQYGNHKIWVHSLHNTFEKGEQAVLNMNNTYSLQ